MASNIAGLDLAHTPAGVPPPGVIPNFAHPKSQGYILIIVTAICYSLMLPIVILRVYCRNWINRSFGLDDGKLASQREGTVLSIISRLSACNGKLATKILPTLSP